VDHVRRRTRGSCRRRLLAAATATLAGILASACAAPNVASESNASHASRSKHAGQGANNSAAAGRRGGSRTAPPAGHRHVVRAKPLAGKIVGIDPGHNGLNGTDPAYLAHQVFNGRTMENCNTTGTRTASGYTESLFNWNVARYLIADLRKDGARVVLTRRNNHGIGPCVDKRSTMLNHTDVAIDIHADGGPSWGRGFTVLEPVADGPNNKVIGSSIRFGQFVHQAILAHTPMRVSNYYGRGGYIFRKDLAGLNLTTVPKVLIECGNMPNPADAALLTTPRVQRRIARALEAAIIRFLTGHWPSAQPTG
jgi:N-acetylmuramoyl-L-alanine amidase